MKSCKVLRAVLLMFSFFVISLSSCALDNNENVTGISRYYQIDWKNYDGTLLYRDSSVKEGTLPVYKGSTPTKPSDRQYNYSFSGWDPTIKKAYSNTTYTAQFASSLKDYTVTWKNYDGTILEIDEKVKYGTLPSYDGVTPTRPSSGDYRYVFSGWAPTLSSVTADATYIAQYKTTTGFVVTWKNYDGSILELDTDVVKNSLPSYDGQTPTKPSDDAYNYTFAGWVPGIIPVTQDATYTATYTAKAKPIEINSISFSQQDIYLFEGTSTSFSYTVNPNKYKNAITFKSYNPSIADVDGTTITGFSSGKTKIIGYGPDGTKSTFNVYVIESISIYLNTHSNYVVGATNSSFNIKERIYYSQEYTETTKQAYNLKFYSLDTSYYDIDEHTGLVQCKNKVGYAKLKLVLFSPISYKEFEIYLVVKERKDVTSWSFTTSEYTLTAGYGANINRTYLPSDANVGGLTFSSTNDEIATVDSSGYISAKNVGSCQIVAYCKILEEYYYFSVTVIGTYATSISSNTSISVAPSETKSISVTYSPLGANIGKRISYFSDNEQVAFVDNEGNVTGVSKGTCNITLTLENEYKKNISVTVIDSIYPTSIKLSSSSLSLRPNETSTLTTTISPSNANVCLKETWTSSDTSIVTVSNGRVRAMEPGNANICVSLSNGVKAYCVVTVKDYIRPNSIVLSETSVTLDPYSSKTITATINPSDSDKDNKLTWTSTNENIATVDGGVIVGVKPGSCKIKVSTENGVYAYCNVTVNDYTYPTSISLNPSVVSIDPNSSVAIVPTILPANSNAGLDIVWKSNNASIATVNNGIITGVAPGTCVITASLSNGLKAECTVTVNQFVYAQSINISSSSISLTKDSNTVLTVSYNPANSNSGKKVSFTTSNASIATIDNSGIITAKSVGTCIITAKLENGNTKSCTVTVTDYIRAEKLTLNKTSVTLNPNQTIRLVCTISPTNAQTGKNVKWSSSNNSVATVSSDGIVKAIDKGSCVITASLENGFAATCSVTVNGVAPIIFDANTKENYSNSLYINCTKGEKIQLESNTKVTYSSSNSSIAYVDSYNKLIAKSVGYCVLTATNSSGGKSEIKVNVFNCSISYQSKTDIVNYEQDNESNQRLRTISELSVSILNYKFLSGKMLELNLNVYKKDGGFENATVGIEIYDSNNNLLCFEVAKTEEKMLFGETKAIIKKIDLSNYFAESYTYNFTIKIVDSALNE